MIRILLPALLLFFTVPVCLQAKTNLIEKAEAPATVKMSAKKMFELWKKPDNREEMLPALKEMYPDAKEYRVTVVIQTEGEQGLTTPPPVKALEKWVDGKWIVSWMEFEAMPKELFPDRTMIQAVTYEPDTKTFIKFVKAQTALGEKAIVKRYNGKAMKEKRGIRWSSDKHLEDSVEYHSDTTTSWTEKFKGNDTVQTFRGLATKVR